MPVDKVSRQLQRTPGTPGSTGRHESKNSRPNKLLHHPQVTPEDSTLSYLPLAHIFDRIVEEFALYSGARIGYYQVIYALLLPTLQGTLSTGTL